MTPRPAAFQRINIDEPKSNGRGGWIVRWRVDGKGHSRTWPNKTQAKRGERELHAAVDRGETFDGGTGYPSSWDDSGALTVAEYAIGWFARNLDGWSPKSRDVHRQSLMHVLVACTDTQPGDRLDQVRLWISDQCSPEGLRTGGVDLERAGEWLGIHSMPLTAVTPAELRDRILPALATNLDGSQAKPSTLSKRRSTLSALLGDAYSDGLIEANPMTGMRRTGTSKAESSEVDVRSIPDPATMRLFICAVAAAAPSARRQVAYLAFTLYTGARPGEVSALRTDDLALPNDGSWGEAVMSGSHTEATGRSGTRRSERGLKARSTGTTRVVPLPPELVDLLRLHMQLWSPTGGHVFRNSEGGLLSKNQTRLISQARERLGWVGTHPYADVTHYTGRHVYISSLIRAGVDVTEIADIVGNSPQVIWTTYAGVFASMRHETLPRIAAALR